MDTRGAKRKSPSQTVVFEISDNDISPEDSDSDCNEPEAKIIKTESNFVSSVVNALSNLESEKDLEIKQKKQSEIEENAPEIIENELNDVPVENSVPSSTVQQKTEAEPCEDFEEGEVEENRIPVKTVVDSSEMLDTECLHITFSNKNMSDLYKFKFLRFVESFVELEVVSEDELSISLKRDPLFNSSEWIIVDEIMVSKNSKEEIEEEKLCSPLPVTPEKAKKKKKKKAKKEKDLFMLDTNPQNENEYNACAKYSSKFQIENNSDIEEEEVRVSSQVCFNCDGSHALKDCQLPKDFNKINQRRQRFKAQKQTSRYHLEEDQKFSHLVPGKISDELRGALGLKKNQLPPYIYQMRILGYPPGWLEEAKFVYSNLELFDSEGKNVKLQGSKKNRGLNSEKIVDYPGFNISMDRNMKDEYKQYQVPPYSENYSKKVMLDFFAKQFCTEDEENEAINTKASNENKDEKEPECKPKHHLLIAVQEKEFGVPSPSLTDLEKEKENLLAALDDNSSSNLKSEENTSEVPDQTADPKASGNAEEADVQEKDSSGSSEKVSVNDTLKIDVEAAEDSSSSNVSPPLNTSVNCVKTSAFGTPILKSNSPFSRLPKADNFMKDVSPVINFENLPDSTGKYEQMTNVLQKVRNTMKHLQNCKS